VLAGGYTARGSIGWALFSATSGLLFVVGFVFTSIGFAQVQGFSHSGQLAGIGGLLQRMTIALAGAG
jgi:hypothetical protein